jgi:hypothetical protein
MVADPAQHERLACGGSLYLVERANGLLVQANPSDDAAR